MLKLRIVIALIHFKILSKFTLCVPNGEGSNATGEGGGGEMALNAVVDEDLWNEIMIIIIIMYKYKKQLKKLKK